MPVRATRTTTGYSGVPGAGTARSRIPDSALWYDRGGTPPIPTGTGTMTQSPTGSLAQQRADLIRASLARHGAATANAALSADYGGNGGMNPGVLSPFLSRIGLGQGDNAGSQQFGQGVAIPQPGAAAYQPNPVEQAFPMPDYGAGKADWAMGRQAKMGMPSSFADAYKNALMRRIRQRQALGTGINGPQGLARLFQLLGRGQPIPQGGAGTGMGY